MKNKEGFMLKPEEVVIEPGRIRQVFNQAKLEKLKRSITLVGQLQPIVLTDNNSLIFGERRLRACAELGQNVWAILEKDLSDLMKLEMEFAENIYRDDVTPSEEILAKDALQSLRSEQKGISEQRISDTADELGESTTQTAEDLRLAVYIKAAPQMFIEARTKTEIKRIAKQLERRIHWDRLERAADKLQKEQEEKEIHIESPSSPKALTEPEPVATKEAYIRKKIGSFGKNLLVADAYVELAKIKEEVGVMFLDPPWGIDHHEKQEKVSFTHEDEGYEDHREEFLEKFPELCKLAYNAMTPDSHLYCFFAIIHFDFVYNCLEDAGFEVNRRPIIALKEGRAHTQVPDKWPGAGYEPIAYARKGKRSLVKRGVADWRVCKWTTLDDGKGHASAKPALLYADLIRRSAYPGDLVCDPMFGTGPAFVACEL